MRHSQISKQKDQDIGQQVKLELESKVEANLSRIKTKYSEEIQQLKSQLKFSNDKCKEIQTMAEEKRQLHDSKFKDLVQKSQKLRNKLINMKQLEEQSSQEISELKGQKQALIDSKKEQSDVIAKLQNDISAASLHLKEKESIQNQRNQATNLQKQVKSLSSEKNKLSKQLEVLIKQTKDLDSEKAQMKQELLTKNQKMNFQGKQIQMLKVKLKNLEKLENQYKAVESLNESFEQRPFNFNIIPKKHQQTQTEMSLDTNESLLPQIALSDNSFNESQQASPKEYQKTSMTFHLNDHESSIRESFEKISLLQWASALQCSECQQTITSKHFIEHVTSCQKQNNLFQKMSASFAKQRESIQNQLQSKSFEGKEIAELRSHVFKMDEDYHALLMVFKQYKDLWAITEEQRCTHEHQLKKLVKSLQCKVTSTLAIPYILDQTVANYLNEIMLQVDVLDQRLQQFSMKQMELIYHQKLNFLEQPCSKESSFSEKFNKQNFVSLNNTIEQAKTPRKINPLQMVPSLILQDCYSQNSVHAHTPRKQIRGQNRPKLHEGDSDEPQDKRRNTVIF